ncbi:MAG: ferredoxin family protein [Lachnospiraceae bacterium]|nr:ferredoxin family protein [Lachnospiraceae bacterium]
MSIRINQKNCVGCGRCIEVCPGNLIKRDADNRAVIRREKDCWGCTSCLKECHTGAIQFFLGADMGGRGSTLSVSKKGAIRTWKVTAPSGQTQTIEVNAKESNQY